jgi:surface antigen
MFKLIGWLINLPFTIAGMIFKALKMLLFPIRRFLWLGIWHGVYYFLVKPKRFLYLGVAVLCVVAAALLLMLPKYQQQNLSPPVPALEGGASPQAEIIENPTNMESVASLPAITGEVQNGNSAFTKPLMQAMSPTDLQLYSSYFYYAMNYAKAENPYRWMASKAFFGEITPQAAFKAKSGVYCRKFKEIISYHGTHERFIGTSCQRDAQSWCKLRRSSALTCGIDKPNSIMLFFSKWF